VLQNELQFLRQVRGRQVLILLQEQLQVNRPDQRGGEGPKNLSPPGD
jgi:hypothetical protein